MKKSTRIFIGAIGLGTILFYGWRGYKGLWRIRHLHVTTQDLDYSDWSSEDLDSQQLVDLNTASANQLCDLGLSSQSLTRLLDNRPYRNKAKLVSRIVLTRDEYSMIKNRVAVAAAREPVKIADTQEAPDPFPEGLRH